MAKMKKLRKARLDRVVEEIDLADEYGEIVCVCACVCVCVCVGVQHRKLGQMHRLFRLKDKMLAVYD